MSFLKGRRSDPASARIAPAEVADIIIRFLDGSGDPYEWDDFTSVPIDDPELEQIRERCASLDVEFPADKPGEYCNNQGVEVLWKYVKLLRSE